MTARMARLRRKLWTAGGLAALWFACAVIGALSDISDGWRWVFFGACWLNAAACAYVWFGALMDLRLLKMADRVQGGEEL